MNSFMVTQASTQNLTGLLQQLSQDPDFTKLVVDRTYSVGSVFLDGNGSLTPPGQGVEGIKWVEEITAQGHLLVGAAQDGAWTVAAGEAAGTLQTTDPHKLTIAEIPAHSHFTVASANATTPEGSPINSPVQSIAYYTHWKGNWVNIGGVEKAPTLGKTSAAGGDGVHTHGLANLERYGVKIWKRVS